jgi:1,2-diacylglycerol 3-alpha-glucosyltransferase
VCNERVNICIVTEYFVGGGFTSALNQKKALEQHGHTVTLMQLLPQPVPSSVPKDAVILDPAFVLPGGLSVILPTKRNQELVRKILVDRKIEVVHFQSEFSLAHMTRRIAQSLGIPTLYTCHTFYWTYDTPFAGLFSVIARLLFKAMLHETLVQAPVTGNAFEKTLKLFTLTFADSCDLVVSPSAHQRQHLIDTGLKPPCAVVPNPYISNATTEPHQLTAAPNPVRLVWMGRVSAEKRPLEFIEAVRLASRGGVKLEVDMLGAGPLLAESQTAAAAVRGVHVRGQQPYEAIVKFVDESSALVINSYRFDNQPMVIAEATSRYRGVIYCDDLLTEGTEHSGYLLPGASPEDMAAGLTDLLNHPDKFIEMSQGAKTDAQLFTTAEYAKKLLAAIATVKPAA